MVYSVKAGRRDALFGRTLDAADLIRRNQRKLQHALPLFTTELQRVLLSAVAFSKKCFKRRSM
jgi:hypothetical protein